MCHSYGTTRKERWEQKQESKKTRKLLSNGVRDGCRRWRDGSKKKSVMPGYAERDAILRDMGFRSYSSYLGSKAWLAIRCSVMTRDGALCVLCGKPGECVHHGDYERATMSGDCLDGLHTLCDGCHRLIEFGKGGRKRSFYQVCASTRSRLAAASEARQGSRQLDAEFDATCGPRA